jgi:hypothetical protein
VCGFRTRACDTTHTRTRSRSLLTHLTNSRRPNTQTYTYLHPLLMVRFFCRRHRVIDLRARAYPSTHPLTHRHNTAEGVHTYVYEQETSDTRFRQTEPLRSCSVLCTCARLMAQKKKTLDGALGDAVCTSCLCVLVVCVY